MKYIGWHNANLSLKTRRFRHNSGKVYF